MKTFCFSFLLGALLAGTLGISPASAQYFNPDAVFYRYDPQGKVFSRHHRDVHAVVQLNLDARNAIQEALTKLAADNPNMPTCEGAAAGAPIGNMGAFRALRTTETGYEIDMAVKEECKPEFEPLDGDVDPHQDTVPPVGECTAEGHEALLCQFNVPFDPLQDPRDVYPHPINDNYNGFLFDAEACQKTIGHYCNFSLEIVDRLWDPRPHEDTITEAIDCMDEHNLGLCDLQFALLDPVSLRSDSEEETVCEDGESCCAEAARESEEGSCSDTTKDEDDKVVSSTECTYFEDGSTRCEIKGYDEDGNEIFSSTEECNSNGECHHSFTFSNQAHDGTCTHQGATKICSYRFESEDGTESTETIATTHIDDEENKTHDEWWQTYHQTQEAIRKHHKEAGGSSTPICTESTSSWVDSDSGTTKRAATVTCTN